MFKVIVNDLQSYFEYDPDRTADLRALDALIQKAAPVLQCHFHAGTPAGSAGMRMKMIGYGKFCYAIKSGQTSPWPVIGVALQKNYISVYLSVTKDETPLVQFYAGKLGALRMGGNNFSFVKFDQLDVVQAGLLFEEAAQTYQADPQNPVRYMQSD